MKKLKLDLEYCYGIRKLNEEFDFSRQRVVSIYAPNGSMKSSLAQTFVDLSEDEPSKDRYFPSRNTIRKIVDETNKPISQESIFSIKPYDEELSHSEKTSTLLVNSKLRKEYEKLYEEINTEKSAFLKEMKLLSGSKKNLEQEILLTFRKKNNEFQLALLRVKEELQRQKDAPFATIAYDKIFEDKVIEFISGKDAKASILEYISKYNELLEKSTYFKKGIFNYYNAATVAKHLADNGFFDAKHTVTFHAGEKREITSRAELEKVIEEEKSAILNDKELRARFDKFEKQLYKNANLREFGSYLAENEYILPHLDDIEVFREEVWKSYFKTKIDLYNSLLEKYQKVEKRNGEIEEEARKERTQWEKAIDDFNERFHVPFKVEAKNRVAVILAQEPLLNLDFTFVDGPDSAPVQKEELMRGLSTGEKKAFYILNIIFEVETRKKSGQETVFVIDDIADSFDYKNKYAIIEYLKEISDIPHFYQIILTHNFDFFRTIQSRYISYSQCYMAQKANSGIKLNKAAGIKNIFVKDWKPNFYSDSRKRIASIPFIRNIIEYTKGEADPDYLKLTSLLHWKSDTSGITDGDLCDIYNRLFGDTHMVADRDKKVVDLLENEMSGCLSAGDGVNFENKIVLSIAIRLKAEKFMIDKINDPQQTERIASTQTQELIKIFKSKFPSETDSIKVLDRVILMTPENIHLNSFMYEPILDMSDNHLRKLCLDVKGIAGS